MARDFDGSTDRIDIANVWDNAGLAQTLSMWVYPVSVVAPVYFFTGHASGDAALGGSIFFLSGDGQPSLTCLTSADDVQRTAVTATLITGAWKHLLVTWDGGLTAGNIHIYHQGTEVSYAASNSGSGSFTAAGGSHSFGGRITTDTRNFEGRIAEFGHWDREFTADGPEIALLAAGYSPLFIPNGLRIYPKQGMIRDTPHNYLGGETATLDGTTVFDHPRTIYPTGAQVSYLPAAVISAPLPAAVALTLLGVGD